MGSAGEAVETGEGILGREGAPVCVGPDFWETWMHRSKWTSRAALVAASAAVMVVGAGAQSVTQGAISGTVEDTTGAVVPKATVVIVNTGTNATVTLTADDKGFFNAPLLQPGTYKVNINAGGFGPYLAYGVRVQVGLTRTL